MKVTFQTHTRKSDIVYVHINCHFHVSHQLLLSSFPRLSIETALFVAFLQVILISAITYYVCLCFTLYSVSVLISVLILKGDLNVGFNPKEQSQSLV